MPPIGSKPPAATGAPVRSSSSRSASPRDAESTPGGHVRLDPLEQLRVVLLEERVELGRRLVERDVRVAVEQADRGPQRAPRLAPRLLQRPAPGEVEVGVAGEQQRADRWMLLGER